MKNKIHEKKPKLKTLLHITENFNLNLIFVLEKCTVFRFPECVGKKRGELQ